MALERPDVMIFAAGLGTRMAPLTNDRPKPLIEVAGRPLLDHTLELVRDINPRRIVVNTHYLCEQIREHLDGQDVAISDEADLLLDTGGGLRKALPLLGRDSNDPTPVVTLNPDVIWQGGNPVRLLCETWDDSKMDTLLSVIPLERCIGRAKPGMEPVGDFSMDPKGRLTRQGQMVYGGAQIIRPDRLHDIPDEVFSLNKLWDLMIAEGRAFGAVHSGYWCDVGRPDCIPLAEDLLTQGANG